MLLFQVTEKTDCHQDNLQAGFSLWEKLLLLAAEVEAWSTQKLMTLAQTHPFHTELDVSAMQVKPLSADNFRNDFQIHLF